MKLSTMDFVPGYKVEEHIGLAIGNCVMAKNVFGDFSAGLRNLFGGEVANYSDLIRESQQKAMKRMKDRASELGANAVLKIHFGTSSVMKRASEITCYGTAVILEKA